VLDVIPQFLIVYFIKKCLW